ncbi:hypothetical protein JJC03_14675 [Flavobacterium oreochromis]|nr:hypothetical protein [Flavobacterium oreochromis]QYS85501.1 hypothetical protein JJC03_09730 [Flavobacterium oreochromis]QYS86186.1 hypothetical protein JJC03_14675 [Flavobacterium oreochromis]
MLESSRFEDLLAELARTNKKLYYEQFLKKVEKSRQTNEFQFIFLNNYLKAYKKKIEKE